MLADPAWAEVLALLDPDTGHRWPTLTSLARQLDPATVQTPALDLIDQALTDLRNTPDGRLIISMPPQEGKSRRVARDFIVDTLVRQPSTRVVVASYGQALANRNGRAIRNAIATHPELGLRIAHDHGAVHEWTLHGHDGGVLSVGVGAGLTGRPADLLVIDDPIKDRKEADSEIFRDGVWDWWTDAASTRLAPGAPTALILCMAGDTPVLLPDGTEKALRDIRPGDEVATYEGGVLATSTVMNWANQGPDDLYCIRMKSGRVVRANARHPFLTIDANGDEAWVRTDQIRSGQSILTATGASGAESSAQSTGVTCRHDARACATRTTTRHDGQPVIDRLRSMLRRVAGRASNIATRSRMKKLTSSSASRTESAQSAANRRPMPTPEPTGMGSSASIMTTPPARCVGCSATTAISQSGMGSLPRPSGRPLSTWSVTPDEVVSVEPCGREDVFDLQVERTENFIANGLVSHNTRWHDDDLAGRLLAAEDGHLWRVLNIPAQADTDDDPLGRQPGEFMISARGRTTAQWEAIKVRVGARTWASLYQGRPSAAAGDTFKRDWWQTYSVPLWLERADGARIVTGDNDLVIQSWDLTFSDGKKSDYVVGQVWLKRGAHMYLLDQVRGRWDFPETVRQFEALSARWPQALLKLVENKANGPALIASLSKKIVGIVPEEPRGSKQVRAAAASPLAEAGNVVIPDAALAPWVGDWVEELAAFPNGANDDQVDSTVQAINRMALIPLYVGGDGIVTDEDLADLRGWSISPV